LIGGRLVNNRRVTRSYCSQVRISDGASVNITAEISGKKNFDLLSVNDVVSDNMKTFVYAAVA